MATPKKKRPRSSRPKSKFHKRLNNAEKETILALRYSGETIKAIALKTKFSHSTCSDIIAKANRDPEMIIRARAEAARLVGSQLGTKVQMAIDSITPESLQHDRVEVRDAEGNLKEVKHSGANGAQIATAVGILIDKQDKMMQTAEKLDAGGSTKQLGPGQLGDMLASLVERVGKLQSLNVDLDLDGVQAKIALIAAETPAEEDEQIETDYEVLDGD
jgi:hypothetical protein